MLRLSADADGAHRAVRVGFVICYFEFLLLWTSQLFL